MHFRLHSENKGSDFFYTFLMLFNLTSAVSLASQFFREISIDAENNSKIVEQDLSVVQLLFLFSNGPLLRMPRVV